MKPSLQLRIGQQLAMTPQLQQAIRLLQMSTLDLQMEVQEFLDSNMMLEPDEEVDVAPAESETVEPLDIPAELEVDAAWDDIYEPMPSTTGASGSSEGLGDMEVQRGSEPNLSEHLYWQAELARFSPEDYTIVIAIIDSIDESGYLRGALEEIHEALTPHLEELEVDQIQAVLRQVQNFEPSGVGARDLRECLQLQLRYLPEDTPWLAEARALLDQHFSVLGNRDFAQLMRLLRVDREELQQVIGVIQLLHPRPGETVAVARSEYVIPDVVVTQKNGVWRVDLNQEAMPRVRINNQYASMIRRADDSPGNTSMRSHLQEARHLVKALQNRSETLLKVARSIVNRQRAFLELGDEAMQPMVLRDVAEEVGMHESTISRVTTQKYMLTPRGVYELKYFFSSHVSTEAGGEASSTAIRAFLKKLIGAENPIKPLSDSRLASILKDQGINVARRTVAKYRESMLIPSSTERKRLS